MQLSWEVLNRLRDGFLAGTAGRRDYWTSMDDLEQYDATFAQRIGWKWDFVLDELKRLGWAPPRGRIMDWGCGSGIAHRAFFDSFPPDERTELVLWDRSSLAISFSRRKAEQTHAGIKSFDIQKDPVDLLLISHVITELETGELESLVWQAEQSTTVIWVEPGTHAASHQLVAVRERLRKTHGLIAPCPHQMSCGLLKEKNRSHWCHFFASPPPSIFMERFWNEFSREMGIDLRSLPVSYLVLDKRTPPSPDETRVRILGRPEVRKPHIELTVCHSCGLCQTKIERRTQPEWYKKLKKDRCDSLLPASLISQIN